MQRYGCLFMPKVKIDGFQCNRCKHIWVARKKDAEPTVCPKCHSAWWNKERVYRLTKKQGNPTIEAHKECV